MKMDGKKAMKFMEGQIAEMEKATYLFETVLKPRYDADKAILEKMRGQYLKLQILMDKIKAGQEVTTDEVNDCVPSQFR
jgi:hypothetical protein